jgi:hypothetical protein
MGRLNAKKALAFMLCCVFSCVLIGSIAVTSTTETVTDATSKIDQFVQKKCRPKEYRVFRWPL